MALRGIALGGFMGTGKTSVGRIVAKRVGLPFVDLDEAIARRAGASVEAIFAREGEAGFRRREAAELARLVAAPPCVVALGGGTLHHQGVAALGDGFDVVVLDAPLAELRRRLGAGEGRPLWPEAEVRYAERRSDLSAGRVIQTEGLSPEEVAARVIEAVNR